MQTFLTDPDAYRSAHNLDSRRLFSQVYEGIHILASNLAVNDLLVNPKRSVANHPVARMWAPHPGALLHYCIAHYGVWTTIYGPHPQSINFHNLCMLTGYVTSDVNMPPELVARIPYYRELLYSKDPVFYLRWASATITYGLKIGVPV